MEQLMKLFSDLPHNARYSLALEPLWALFGGMILYYAPLYMKAIGLSEVEMGLVNTGNLLAGFVVFFIAAPVTNKIGRRRATFLFDFIAWSIPMLLWAVAHNFWFFLAAGIINASVKGVGVSWNCLLTEDASEDQRLKVYGVIYIMVSMTGILTSRYGIVPPMRILYLAGMVCMGAMFLIRNALVVETKAGLELMEKYRQISLLSGLKNYVSNVSLIFRNKNRILLLCLYILTGFTVSMNFFQIIYFKEQLGLGTGLISLYPAISSLIYILLYAFAIPRLNRFSELACMIAAFFVSIAGSLVFLLIPRQNVPLFLLTAFLLSSGYFVAMTYRDTVFINRVGEHDKADALSGLQTMTALVSIPSGYIAGLLYGMNPVLPFITNLLLFTASGIISIILACSMRTKG